MSHWRGTWLLAVVAGCSVPAFPARRAPADVTDASDLGSDANDVGSDAGTDATDAASAPEVADAAPIDVATDVDAGACGASIFVVPCPNGRSFCAIHGTCLADGSGCVCDNGFHSVTCDGVACGTGTTVACHSPDWRCAPEILDAATMDIATDANATDAVSAPEVFDAATMDVATDANATDAPLDVAPADTPSDASPPPDRTALLVGTFVSSAVPSTPTGLLSGGFTWQGNVHSDRLEGWLR